MSSSIKLDKDEWRISVDITMYRGLIESLLYLIASRLDIMLMSVCVQDLKQTLSNHIILQLNAFLNILRYFLCGSLVYQREIFREIVDAHCPPDIVTYGIMVDILCKAGRTDEAVQVIKEMEFGGCQPTSFIYSVLVHTYGNENRIEDAINIFFHMEKNGVKPDVAVYNALVSAFCKANKFQNAYKVVAEMDDKGVRPNSRTCNILMNSLIDHGESDQAIKVFCKLSKICEPDADTYTMMIKMFCEREEFEMALKAWRYMKNKQFAPGMHTFCALVNGLISKADVSRACVLMEEMIERGLRPGRHTFGKLRQLLLKEGRNDVLEFLHEKMNLLVEDPLYD